MFSAWFSGQEIHFLQKVAFCGGRSDSRPSASTWRSSARLSTPTSACDSDETGSVAGLLNLLRRDLVELVLRFCSFHFCFSDSEEK